jgi:hypothetical protein
MKLHSEIELFFKNVKWTITMVSSFNCMSSTEWKNLKDHDQGPEVDDMAFFSCLGVFFSKKKIISFNFFTF